MMPGYRSKNGRNSWSRRAIQPPTTAFCVEAPDLPEEVREDFETIRRALLLEAKLVDDLLDIARLIEGKLQLDIGHPDVHPIVRRAYSVIASGLAASAAKVEFELHEEELLVSCDPARLQQVVWNLLRNALSHTPANGVVLVRSRKGEGRVS